MPKIVFQHKQHTPPPTTPVAPTKSSKPRRLSAPPPVTNTPPTQVVRSKPVVQAPPPVIEEKPIPVAEAPKPEPVVEITPPVTNNIPHQTETVVSTSDDDWGIMQVTKKKSAKEISKSVQQTVQSTTGNAVVLDGSGVALLIETIVTELGKQFVRKDEVVDLVTLALQKMVMEDVKPK